MDATAERGLTALNRDTPCTQVVRQGERFVLWAQDWCYGKLSSNPGTYEAMQRPRCPITGPVEVEGAKVGDSIAITIHEIRLSNVATIARLKGVGPLAPASGRTKVWDAQVQDGAVSIAGIRLRAEPMIGVIGVRPDSAEPVQSRWTGRYGGNLDTNEIAAGSIVEFPVLTRGAGVFLGDLHAAMGDGEMTGTGVEAAGEVTLSARVIKGRAAAGPRIRRGVLWITLHTDPDFRLAAAEAATAMQQWVMQERGLDDDQAAFVVGMAGGLGVSQVVNPAGITAKVHVDWSKVL